MNPFRRLLKCHRTLIFVIGIFLLISGLRLALLAAFGSDVPYWDEWPAIGSALFKPWVESTFSWLALFPLHNGHRIVLTRLWELCFFNLNDGRWDPLLVQTANAFVAAAAAGFIAGRFFSEPTLPRRRIVLAVTILLLAVPFGYSNLLIAFQSQFLFFVLFTVVAFGLWTEPKPSPARLALGGLCAAFALLTVGTGLVIAGTLWLVAATRCAQEKPARRLWLAALIAASAIILTGLALHGPTGESFSFLEIFSAAGRYLAWPVGNLIAIVTSPDFARYLPRFLETSTIFHPLLSQFSTLAIRHATLVPMAYWVIALCLHTPGAVVAWRSIRSGLCGLPGFIAALWIWALVNIVAMSVARADQLLVPPRYQDILMLGLLANFLALILWLLPAPLPPRKPLCRSLASRLACTSWIVVTSASIALTIIGIFFVQLPRKHAENHAAALLIQRYLVSRNVNLFIDQPPNYVPWPNQEVALAHVLVDPTINRILPVGLYPPAQRPPRPLASRFALHIRTAGIFLALAGAFFLVSLSVSKTPEKN